MKADVQTAVAENFNPGRATSGVDIKENRPTLTAAGPAVSDQRCIGSSRAAVEFRSAAACAADRAAVVDDCRAASARAVGDPGAAVSCAGVRSAIVDDCRA